MRGWRMLVVGGGLALAVGCSGGDDGEDGSGDEPSEAEEPSLTTDEESPTTEEESPTTDPTPDAPATTAPPGDTGAAPLPDVVGMDPQLAQDTMQAAGFYGLISHDATGEGRLQVLDRNWTVCDQSPAADTATAADTIIDLGAVKDDETCP